MSNEDLKWYCDSGCKFTRLNCIGYSSNDKTPFSSFFNITLSDFTFADFESFFSNMQSLELNGVLDFSLSPAAILELVWAVCPYWLTAIPMWLRAERFGMVSRAIFPLLHMIFTGFFYSSFTTLCIIMINVLIWFSNNRLHIPNITGYFIILFMLHMTSITFKSALVSLLLMMITIVVIISDLYRDAMDSRRADGVSTLMKLWFLVVIADQNRQIMESFAHDSLILSMLNFLVKGVFGYGETEYLLTNSFRSGKDILFEDLTEDAHLIVFGQALASLFNIFFWLFCRACISTAALQSTNMRVNFPTLWWGLYLYFVSGYPTLEYFINIFGVKNRRRGSRQFAYHTVIFCAIILEMFYSQDMFMVRMLLECFESTRDHSIRGATQNLSEVHIGEHLTVFSKDGCEGFADMKVFNTLCKSCVKLMVKGADGSVSSGMGSTFKDEFGRNVLMTVNHVAQGAKSITVVDHNGAKHNLVSDRPGSFTIMRLGDHPSDPPVMVSDFTVDGDGLNFYTIRELGRRDVDKVVSIVSTNQYRGLTNTKQFQFLGDSRVSLRTTFGSGDSGSACYAMVSDGQRLDPRFLGVVSSGTQDPRCGNLVATVKSFRSSSITNGISGLTIVRNKYTSPGSTDMVLINETIEKANLARAERVRILAEKAGLEADLRKLGEPNQHKAKDQQADEPNQYKAKNQQGNRRRKSTRKDAAAEKQRLNDVERLRHEIASRLNSLTAIDADLGDLAEAVTLVAQPEDAIIVKRAFDNGLLVQYCNQSRVRFSDADSVESGQSSDNSGSSSDAQSDDGAG